MNSFADARELLLFIITANPESNPEAHVVLTRLGALGCLPTAITRSVSEDSIGFTFVMGERRATIEVYDDGETLLASWTVGVEGSQVQTIPNTEDAMYDAIREIQAWLQPLAQAVGG